MQSHEFLNQREPDPGAFMGSAANSFEAVKSFEDFSLLIFGNSQARIFNPQLDSF